MLRPLGVAPWSRCRPLGPTRGAGRCLSTLSAHKHSICFFGSDQISLKTLDLLVRNSEGKEGNSVVSSLEVVCPSDKPKGKGLKLAPVPVKEYAQQHALPIHQPCGRSFKTWEGPPGGFARFDLGVVVSFGYLIPNWILGAFRLGVINMHPSLLPKYRGPAPMYHTILNNDSETGVSIIELDPERFDAGKILLQWKHTMKPDVTYGELSEELADLGARAVLHTLRDFEALKASAQQQNDALATHAPKVWKKSAQVNWAEQSAQQVHILYRAFGDTLGIWTHLWTNATVKLRKVRVRSDTEAVGPPGAVVLEADKLVVQCARGTVAVEEVQPETRTPISAVAFANGYMREKDKQYQFLTVPV